MSKFLFYPGCSMESNALAYHESLMAIRDSLGIDLVEIEDWNCCGATEYLGVSLVPAYALIARNLALAVKQSNGSRTVVASCSACYLNLAKADHYMAERPLLGEKVNEALAAGGLEYQAGSLDIRHLLDVIINEVGLDRVRDQVVKPLKGLRVAPYLGCMVPRPDYNKHWSDAEHPNELDRLLKALGAEVIDFPLKTHCCGGHMTQISPDTAFEMIGRLLVSAHEYHADVIATVCPMCQLNLDAYQGEALHYLRAQGRSSDYKIPILFFTQLMGVAFGRDPGKLGFGREFVNASQAMSRIGVETPTGEESQPQPRRKKATGLPMPVMPGQTGEEE
ncbi:MAG: CoB--CoM heterodisulfide reductase iron-sulfur subunit B family protein [Anaerolineales bacterium]|nr:CoB--CoM heterodisulfide reductase iron-sulfur subunit B family protein [Anaerolineales bacterium]